MKNKNRGIVGLFVLILLIIMAIFAIGAVFVGSELIGVKQKTTQVETVDVSQVSDSVELDVLERELDDTQIGSVDEDINKMESDASTL